MRNSFSSLNPFNSDTAEHLPDTVSSSRSQYFARHRTSSSQSFNSAFSPSFIDAQLPMYTSDYEFVDGEERLRQIPQQILDDLYFNFRKFEDRIPPCAQPITECDRGDTFFETDGIPTPFVKPGSNHGPDRVIPAARYRSKTLQREIVVVQGAFRPHIVIPSNSSHWSSGKFRHGWHSWNRNSRLKEYTAWPPHWDKLALRPESSDLVGYEEARQTANRTRADEEYNVSVKAQIDQVSLAKADNTIAAEANDNIEELKQEEAIQTKPKRKKSSRRKVVVVLSDDEDEAITKKLRLDFSTSNMATSSKSSSQNTALPSVSRSLTRSSGSVSADQLSSTILGDERSSTELPSSHFSSLPPTSGTEAQTVTEVKIQTSPPPIQETSDPQTSNPSQAISALHKVRYFKFSSDAEGPAVDNYRVPVNEIKTPRDVFDYAICCGVATIDTTILKVRLQGDTTWIAKKYNVFFQRLLDKIGSITDEDAGDVIVIKTE